MNRFTRSELEEAFSTLFGETSSQKSVSHKGKTYKIDVGFLIAAVGFYVYGYYQNDPKLSFLGTVFLFFFVLSVVISILVAILSPNPEGQGLEQILGTKYLPHVEHTEGYGLLLEALKKRKNGVVEGLGNKETTEKYLRELWITAFAQADLLETDLFVIEAPEEEPVGVRIKELIDRREEAREELGGAHQEVANGPLS